MKTTSGSLSLLSATNRWCLGTNKGVSMAPALLGPNPPFFRQHHPNCPQFPSQVEPREPAELLSPLISTSDS